jgi:hypothetical protein
MELSQEMRHVMIENKEDADQIVQGPIRTSLVLEDLLQSALVLKEWR